MSPSSSVGSSARLLTVMSAVRSRPRTKIAFFGGGDNETLRRQAQTAHMVHHVIHPRFWRFELGGLELLHPRNSMFPGTIFFLSLQMCEL